MDIDRDEIAQSLLRLEQSHEVGADELAAAHAVLTGPDAISVPEPLVAEVPEVPLGAPSAATNKDPAKQLFEDEGTKDIRAQIAEMNMPQKIKLAMFGNAICRGLLIFDASRMIQQFVLKNPKLQLREVEAFARNPNMSDFVLRAISESRNWMRNYSMKLSIVLNPKTPGDVALKWMRFCRKAT